MSVNKNAEILPTLSPKFKRPTPKEPNMMVKLSQLRKVLSLAKKTFGSTLVGRAILLPGVLCSNGADDISIVSCYIFLWSN